MGALKDYLLFLINSVCFNFLQFFINSKAELKVKTELVCGSPNDELQITNLVQQSVIFNAKSEECECTDFKICVSEYECTYIVDKQLVSVTRCNWFLFLDLFCKLSGQNSFLRLCTTCFSVRSSFYSSKLLNYASKNQI